MRKATILVPLLALSRLVWADASQPRLSSISAVEASRPAGQTVAIRGSVTHTGRQIFIQDSTGALRLQGGEIRTPLALGDEVEAVGTPSFDRTPSLLVHSIRRLWGGSTPLPLALDPDRAADGNANGLLVQVDAKLTGEGRAVGGEFRLVLQGGSQTFAATLPISETPSSVGLPMWPLNSELRLVGVLVLNPDPPALADAPFQLLLGSDQDVEVMRAAPWWNLEHTAWVSLAAGLLFLLGYLQWQHVRSARLRAVLEERGRIARDIHDTLAQGFAGITLQLESAEVFMQKDADAAWRALKLALQMVRRSRTDSHASIRVLRSLSRDESLHMLFEVGIAEFASKNLSVMHYTEGSPYATSYEITNQLFHIGMEAFANAVQHAHASEISLTTQYDKQDIAVSVIDNGCGFDPAAIAGAQHGHLGLTGMRERAASIGAKLTIDTSPGTGTAMHVCAARRS